jgi:hypothetical protein
MIIDPKQAPQLLGDCDVIANFALGAGRPAEARRQNEQLIDNATRYAPPHAKVIYFSTISVYGDPLPTAVIRWRGSYGREKIRCEQWQRRAAKRYGRATYILRLGHVCGDLQGISLSIRDQIADGTIVLAGDGAGASNTVHVDTIVDAILQIAAGNDPPGTYDLMCNPSWSWRQVYEHEARTSGLPLVVEEGPIPPVRKLFLRRFFERFINVFYRSAALFMASPAMREFVLRGMARLPVSWNERIQAKYYCRRAAAEIAALRTKQYSRDSFVWVPLGKRFLTSLHCTSHLLGQPAVDVSPPTPSAPFPEDLPLASVK